MGKGIAIVTLWPLDSATNAERSRNLRTGFLPPSIATVAAHVSTRGRGPDVRLLVGEEELKAAIATKTKSAAPPVEATAVEADSPQSVAADEAEGTDGGVAAGGDSARKREGGGEGDGVKEGDRRREAGGDRTIALELEIFACGAIDVSRLIEVIKGCFEQVNSVGVRCCAGRL